MASLSLVCRHSRNKVGFTKLQFHTKPVVRHILRQPSYPAHKYILPCCFGIPVRGYHSNTKQSHNTTTQRKWGMFWAAAIAGGTLATGVYLAPLEAKEDKGKGKSAPLPVYTSEEVRQHDSLEKRIWVSFGSGVYDVTDFVPEHPGGDKILMASGGALEPFWELYAAHKTDQVMAILEDYRIGTLNESDVQEVLANSGDPYSGDPKRHPALKPSSVNPFNAEPPMSLLVESFLTPNIFFFVRNHLPVPNVDLSDYELEISGIGVKTQTLTLQDLKTKFPKKTITTTIQCAGNRRSELNKIKEVKGLNWGAAAISTAQWSGASLLDVLRYLEADINDPRIQHVHFEGLDTDPANAPYAASVPADKALNPMGDVLLAYEMNGEPIPKDHGYPVRAIVPGVVGARNVKWLGRIELSSEESDSHWQKRDYKGFSPNIDWNNVDFDSAPAIQELPVNSAICEPSQNQCVKAVQGHIPVKGYAWSGGGKKIVRVDVSGDSGLTWHTANLQQEGTPLNRTWSWTIWEVQIPVPAGAKEMEMICKATDASYNVQPETFAPIWNLRGVLGNAWHRVKVLIE